MKILLAARQLLLFPVPERPENKEHDNHTYVKRNGPIIPDQITRCIGSLPNTMPDVES